MIFRRTKAIVAGYFPYCSLSQYARDTPASATAVQFVSTRTAAVSNSRGWWRTVLDTHPHPHTQDKLAAFPPH